MRNIELIGAIDDQDGRTISVYQDHDGIRLDLGAMERIFLIGDDATELIGLLSTAKASALLWKVQQATEDETAGNCSECWHLLRIHDSNGCGGRVFPGHSLTGEPCPCTVTP